jgi:murein DD-endopeptidase MepM/ murein hydrolase activator NlpD
VVFAVDTPPPGIRAHRGELDPDPHPLHRRRQEREAELKSFKELAQDRSTRIQRLKQTSQTTAKRLSVLARDEENLIDVLASLEKARRSTPARPAQPNAGREAGGLSTADLGRLDWPVQGRILHGFGPDSLASGGRITRHGVSIAAAAGTPVIAVGPGRVVLVQRLGTYGLSVILEHPNGYYSLYMQLSATTAKVGDQVGKGQSVGLVGGENTPEGSHLYFEIRGENQIALDPTDWLRRRN